MSARYLGLVLLAGLLGACSSTADKPKPAELAPLVNTIGVKQAWSVPLAAPLEDFETAVADKEIVAASRDGQIVRVEVATGRVVSRFKHERPLTAAVGADAQRAAVVDVQNELVVFDRAGAVLWQQRLPASVITSPIIANGLVVVLSSDQTLQAFEAADGSKRWTSTRQAPGLLLNRAGGLTVDGDTLYAAMAQGRLAALSLASGVVRWEQPVVTARGANEIERLTDLVGKPVVNAGDVCVRAYQAGIVCAEASTGKVKWQKAAESDKGIAMDSRTLYATESNGKVLAFNRLTGDAQWTNDKFAYRGLSAPQALGRTAVFGDFSGLVHFLNRDEGAELARMSTDGTAISGQPVLTQSTLIVRSQGALFAFVPE
jgi:outer membrane assembly lipoprotein YfgL